MTSEAHHLDSLEGFERLYRAYYGYAWTVLVRLGVPPALVDDAHQDVFVTAYRRRDTFQRGRPVKPWLVGIARRVAFRYRRSQRRTDRKQTALVHMSDRDRLATASVHARIEAGQFLQAFIETLAPEQREVFVLAELEGHSGPEIAERLGINLNTAYTRLRTVRGQLRRALSAVEDRRVSAARIERGLVLVLPRLAEPGPLAGLWTLLVKAKAGVVAGVAGAGVAAAVVIGGAPHSGSPGGGGAGDRGAVVRRGSEGGAKAGRAVAVEASSAVVEASLEESSAVVEAPLRPGSFGASLDASSTSVVSAPQAERDASGSRGASAARLDPANPATRAKAEPRDDAAREGRAAGVDASTDLEREVEQLTAAREALAAGRPAEALASIEAHERAHPTTPLAEARGALRIASLCALGRREQARREAEALLRRYPGSTLAHHASTRCDEPGVEAAIEPVSVSDQ